MQIPVELSLFGIEVRIHLILEYLAFFTAFGYYQRLRNKQTDLISSSNRLSIILGAAIGALIGSRVVAFLEYPLTDLRYNMILNLLNAKTIMGGLFGGLLGVECAKLIIGEKRSSGDLFTLPIIVGIAIGRIGCFLSGTNEFTYGSETSFLTGMNLGDGLLRHPIALYEILFLSILFIAINYLSKSKDLESGSLFKIFMLSYFGMRFLLEFIKPNQFFVLGLSSIQWLCILCWIYYSKTLLKAIRYAH